MSILNSILEASGHTPLVRLQHMTEPGSADLLVKVEALNVGGSIKTRTALGMIEAAEREGRLGPKSVIVEPTSGNQGIGLALVGAVKGYRVVIIMPDSVSEERRLLIEQYGAQVVLVHDTGDIGKCMEECVRRARQMAAEDPNVCVPGQFSNPANPYTQKTQTGREILEQADVPIDGFCAGFGTGGTVSGVGSALREANPDTLIWIAEPESAAVLSGGCVHTHIQMGIGDGIIPDNLDMNIFDEIVKISDAEAVETARRLARQEGILAGISSGTNVAAALRMAKRLGPGKTVVTVLPDTGERYFSTPLFEKKTAD